MGTIIEFFKHGVWAYFDGRGFRDLRELADKEERNKFIVDDRKILGKVIFHGATTRRGARGYGILYLASPQGLIMLSIDRREIVKLVNLSSPHFLTEQHGKQIEKLFRWRDKISEVITSLKPELLGNITWSEDISDMFEEPLNYLGKIISFSEQGRERSLRQVEKLLHQIYTLFMIPKVVYGEVLNQHIRLKQYMGCGIEKVDFMMPLTWGSPSLKFRLDNTVYSVWHEFSAPHPVDVGEKLRRLKDGEDIFSVIKRETTRRFDIIVMKGDYDTLFKEKPKFGEVEKMSLEEF